MLVLDYNNVEEVIFSDQNLVAEMPRLKHYYDQWRLSVMSPVLRPLGQRSKLDFLRNMTDEETAAVRRKLGTDVTVVRGLDHRLVNNFDCDVKDLEPTLNRLNPEGYVRLYVEGTRAFVSVWR